MADNAQTIIDLDRKRMQAMADKDIDTLNTLLADDLIYTHSSARLDTKQSLIGNMQSGATVYNAVEPSDVKAQDLGSAVVLTGVARIRATSGGEVKRRLSASPMCTPAGAASEKWGHGSPRVWRNKERLSAHWFPANRRTTLSAEVALLRVSRARRTEPVRHAELDRGCRGCPWSPA